jgi:hypothetical protein
MVLERLLGDVVGHDWSAALEGAQPLMRVPLQWRFRPDPADIGRAEQWFTASIEELSGPEWAAEVRVDRAWIDGGTETRTDGERAPAFAGRGWIACIVQLPSDVDLGSRELVLAVQGALGHLTLYVDGKPAGEHDAGSDGASPTSVSFALGPEVNVVAPHVFMLRVEDDSETPLGIWRPLWLATRERAEEPGGDGEG